MPPKKGDKKDDKKGGKGKDDGKKGKGKKPVSESEEEEEEVEVKTEEEGDEEVVPMKGKGKGKGKAALKGASKAIVVKGFKQPSADDKKGEDKGKPMKKGMGAVNLKKMSDVHIKGASKAMIGFAAEGTKKGMPSKQQQLEKTKPKRNLKSTSRLFIRLSKKNKPAANGKPLLGTTNLFSGFGAKSLSTVQKPGLSAFSQLNKKDDSKQTTIDLSSLGGKGKMATQAKGLGGKFKGMFGKKKDFKTKGWMLGRIATATNWLTGRFLTSKGQGQLGERAGGHERKRLSFANRNIRGRETQYYNDAYEYDDEYGYEEEYHDSWRPRGFLRRPQTNDPYGEEGYYYDDDEWEDEYGYYDDEGNFYDDDEFYYDDDIYYYNYPYGYFDDEYEDYYGDEGMEYYYGEDGMLYAMEAEPYGYYGNSMDGFYNPCDQLYGDYFDPNMGYNYGMSDPYGMMSGGYDVVPGLYDDLVLGYTDPVAIYSPYQQHFYIDAGLVPAETGQLHRQEQLSYPLDELSFAEQFRVPRPQVRLFGKDKLEVETLPPPPHHHSHLSTPVFTSPSPALALNNIAMLSDIQYEQPLPTYPPAKPHYSTVMNQQQTPILPIQATLPTAGIIQQENFPVPQPNQPPFSVSPSHLPPSPLPQQFASQIYQPFLPQDPYMFQMGQMSPMMPPIPIQPQMPLMMQSPMASPRPVRRMSPLPSPQLSLRPGSTRAMAPPSPHIPPHHMDFQKGIQPDTYISPNLHRRRFTQRVSVECQRPASPLGRRRPPSPPASPTYQRKGMSVRAQPSLARGRGRIGLGRAPSTVRPQSPLSSPVASPRTSLRKRASPPPSPRLSFRQQPPPEAVPLPPTRPHLFKGRKQTSKMRHSPSPSLSSPQRRSPPLPERAQSPPQTFRPTSPRHPPSPSPSHITSRPLPTRSSTRRLRGGAGVRSHVPMGAVKPSPANPYLQRRSRHGPPVTQHVAPFRSSIHSGQAPPPGQMGGVAGAPMLARTGSQPTGLRDSKRIGTPQGGFHRPVGRGQPLVRMPRNQPSLPSRQSFRAPPLGPPVSPPSSLKQSVPLSHQPSVRRLQSRPQSPQPLQRGPPIQPSHSAYPMHNLSHPPSPLPHRAMSPQNLGPTSFQPLVAHHSFSPGAPFSPSQNISQHGYTMMEPGPSPMLTNALPHHQVPFPPSPLPYPTTGYSSPLQRPSTPQRQYELYLQNLPPTAPSSPYLGHMPQNPYLQNVSNPTPLQRGTSSIHGRDGEVLADAQASQERSLHATPGLSNALMQNSHLRSASYASPLLRNANVYTNVLSPPNAATPLAPSVSSSPHLSSAMFNSQLRNASFASPLQRHLSPMSHASPAPPSTTPQQGTIRGTSPLVSGGLQTSKIQGSMFRLPSGTLTMSQIPVAPPVATNEGSGVSGGDRLSPSVLSNALQNPSLRQATYRLPDGSLVTRTEPAETSSGQSPLSSSMLSSALLNPSLRQATYRLPDGSLVTRTEPTPAPPPSSPMLSSALLNPNVRKATYRLPDGTLITRNESVPEPVTTSTPVLSSALLNANVRKATYRLPDGTLVTRNDPVPEPVTTSSSVLSSALLNANIRGASYRLPDGSILTRPGEETQNTESAVSSPGLSSALMNANLRKAKFQLPDGSSLFSRNQTQAPTSTSSGPALSGALLNTNIRGSSYRLPNTSLFKQPGSADANKSRSLDLSNALRNQNLKSATYRLPDGTLMNRAQPASASQSIDLSNALSKNPNLRGANYRLPDGNIMRRLGAPTTPEPRSLNLSGALQNPHLRGASYRLPSSYAVVSPQVQGSGPEQHWAHGPGVDTLGLQQDTDVWGAERVLPHGTVQNLNKWSMYRDGELLDPHSLMGQGHVGHEQGEWNLSREGEPQGQWFDKVKKVLELYDRSHFMQVQ